VRTLDFDVRIGSLGLRSCTEQLLSNGAHVTAEIIEWSEPERKSCYVVAFWNMGKEGFDLHFVGDRPFHDTVSREVFFQLAELGQKQLDSYFRHIEE